MWAVHLEGAMGPVQKTVLPFKLAASDESLTAQSRPALVDEYLRAMGIRSLIDHELPGPGSTAGYSPSVHVLPLVLMLAGGGRTLEVLRVLRDDEVLRSLLRMNDMPSSDATGDWLRRMGATESGGLAGRHAKGKKISAMRADSAAYQVILNYCEETNKSFALGADQDAAVKTAIANIPEAEWKAFRDGEIAETVHCMNETRTSHLSPSPE